MLHGGSVGLHGGVLSYMVESIGLCGGEYWVTWWRVLSYMVGSVVLHGGCWITWRGVLGYLVNLLLGSSRLLARGVLYLLLKIITIYRFHILKEIPLLQNIVRDQGGETTTVWAS